jgi:probable F420-dependent oxidoreductase
LASLADTADILRRLWAGETVSYSGPAGHFPELRMAQRPDCAPPPLLLAAVGPKTLDLAGAHFDGVILHPFLTPDAVRRSVERVRAAARAAGRDPDALRSHAAVVTACDLTTEQADLAMRSRAAGYFHVSGLGDALVRANGWDESDLARYRAQPSLAALGGRQADKALPRDELVEVSRYLPQEWIESSAVVGVAASCAARLREYLAAGADEIVLHGSTAEHFATLAAVFSANGS